MLTSTATLVSRFEEFDQKFDLLHCLRPPDGFSSWSAAVLDVLGSFDLGLPLGRILWKAYNHTVLQRMEANVAAYAWVQCAILHSPAHVPQASATGYPSTMTMQEPGHCWRLLTGLFGGVQGPSSIMIGKRAWCE